ncbi:MAG: hypothetical protein IJM58_02070 [Muribaculaceae bacterium]|nr:hypothetical protein [Muribaculaceae bacterium]
MKNIKLPLWLAGLAVISASLVSCDPVSSVDYKLYNKTSDTVTVAMYKEILSSSYGGFAIVESDSVTTYYGEADSVNVAVLAPDQVLWVHDEWDGLYREELVVPFWKYIKTIKTSDREWPSDSWDSEPVWHLETEGGKRFEGESRYYILTLRDK